MEIVENIENLEEQIKVLIAMQKEMVTGLADLQARLDELQERTFESEEEFALEDETCPDAHHGRPRKRAHFRVSSDEVTISKSVLLKFDNPKDLRYVRFYETDYIGVLQAEFTTTKKAGSVKLDVTPEGHAHVINSVLVDKVFGGCDPNTCKYYSCELVPGEPHTILLWPDMSNSDLTEVIRCDDENT